MTPVRALLNSRGARASAAIEQLRTAVNSEPERGVDVREVPLVLGWLLSGAARAEMRKQLPAPRQCDEVRDIQNECSFGETVARSRPPATAPHG